MNPLTIRTCMMIGTCPLGDRRTWAAWVVDSDNRPLWESFVQHASQQAAVAAATRALASLERGEVPTEP